jgi:hypothetical protein
LDFTDGYHTSASLRIVLVQRVLYNSVAKTRMKFLF